MNEGTRSPDIDKALAAHNAKFVGRDRESDIYKIELNGRHVVAKDYSKFVARHGAERAGKILGQYFKDVAAAVSYLEGNHNPLEQTVKLKGEEFELYFEIKPQVGEGLEGLQQEPLIVGQAFVEGPTLKELLIKAKEGEELKFYEEVFEEIKEFYEEISAELDTSFSFDADDVKIFFERKNKRIKIVLTDLIKTFEDYFEENEKFDRLRILKAIGTLREKLMGKKAN